MKKFASYLVEKTVNFPEDEFTEYKYKVQIPRVYFSAVTNWLSKQMNSIDDEFVIEAIEEIIRGFSTSLEIKNGIDFTVSGTKMSVYSFNAEGFFTSNNKLTFDKIKKIIGV